MQYLDFNELYQADYDLDDLFVMNQNWQDGDFFSTIGAPRKQAHSCILQTATQSTHSPTKRNFTF